MQQLYEKYKNGYSNSPEYSVNFYNDNLILFKNSVPFKSADELILFVEIYYQCINAFVNKGQYKNAIKALDILPSVEDAIDEFNIARSEFTFYRWLLNQQAISYYYLKDYSTAKKIFKISYNYDPQNDNFKMWIEYSQLGQIQRVLPLFMIISVLSFVGEKISKNMAPFTINHICAYIAGTSFSVFIFLTLYIQWKRSKKKI